MRKYLTKLFLTLFFGIINLQTIHSQNTNSYELSLKEAISFALDNSYTALQSKKEVAKALQQKWETTARGLPQINGEVNYLNYLRQPVSLIPAQIVNPNANAGEFAAVTFGTKQQASLNVTLSQLIFDGSYLVGLEAVSVFIDYTKNTEEKQKINIVKGIVNSYGGVLLAKENQSVLEKNIDVLNKNITETQQIYANGFTEQESLEQLQLTKLQLQNQLDNAKRLVEISKKMLKLSLGIPIQNSIILTDTLLEISTQSVSSGVNLQDFKLQENNDFKQVEILLEQRSLEVKLEKSKALPSLGAFVNFGTSAFNNDFKFLSFNERWFASSIFGATLKVPIFSSYARKAATTRAKLNLEQAEITFKEVSEQLQLGYEKAKSDFEYAVSNLNILEKHLALAKRIENKNQIKFKEGIATSFELRQAQNQLYTAQFNYLQAQLQVVNAKAELEALLNNSNNN